MTKILVHRFYQALFVAWSVGTLTFILMRFIPGDVAYRIAAGRYGYDYVNADAALAVRAELGLDRSASPPVGVNRWVPITMGAVTSHV